MKKLFLLTMAAAAAMLTACLDSDNSAYDRIARIAPGADIYALVSRQNDVAFDAARIGLRFGILLAEADRQEATDLKKVDGWVDTYNYGNLYTRYFGSRTALEVSEAEAGVYRLVFEATGGECESFRRTGTYSIATGGVLLDEATSAQPWTVSIASQELTLETSSEGAKLASYPMSVMQLYRDGDAYVIRFSNFVCRSISASGTASQFSSSWSGDFSLSAVTEGDLTFAKVIRSSFKFSGTGGGQTCYSLNTLTAASMSYSVNAATSLIYTPSKSGYYPVGGRETARLTRISDYDPTYFVSPEVEYEWKLNGTSLSYIIRYNGAEEIF